MHEWLVGGGELGSLIRAKDWSSSPLGPPEGWPIELRTILALMLDSTFAMCVLWGPDLITFYNDACAEVLGEQHPRALGRPVREYWGDRWSVIQPRFEAIMRGESFHDEQISLPLDRHGYVEQVLFTGSHSPVRYRDGSVAGVFAVMIETTWRVAEQARLVHERELALEVLEHGDPICVFDEQARFVLANAAYEELLQRPRADLIGRYIWEVVPELVPPEAKHLVREWKVLSERVPVHEEMYFPARDTWVDVSAYPTRGGGFAVFHRDVGDRKRAEQAERERLEQEVEVRERRFIQLFQSMLEGVQIAELVRDERGRVVDVRMLDINPAYEVHTGLSREQVVGRLGSEFTTLEPMFLEHVARVIATGEPARFEEYNVGLARWFDISLFSLAEGDRFAAVFKDTTARRRAEQALREADRRKDEFLAMLSHELRNPLGAISNAVFLLEQTRDRGRAERARMVIERQTRHLTRMIDDLLDVTRISRGKIKLVREPVELRELVRSAIEDQRELFASKGVALELVDADRRLPVDADPTRLAQVIDNLLTNAAKFTGAGGYARVVLERVDDHALVRVIDTGAGIAADTLARVFEPFVQADETLDRSHGGLGLGLALVKALVEMHGGSVEAHSEGLGKGTEFRIRLPLSDHA